MVQFGINGDPKISAAWRAANILDDKPTGEDKKSNSRGYISFATAGPNTRTTQVFINYKDNASLDSQGFTPFGVVSKEGMKVVDAITGEYGESPDQTQIQMKGNAYLQASFPNLDYIKTAAIVPLAAK
jgi:peptidyl-prolyl cis-trans isomerase A (cyclophilin A)